MNVHSTLLKEQASTINHLVISMHHPFGLEVRGLSMGFCSIERRHI
jgi:hypothetical protein